MPQRFLKPGFRTSQRLARCPMQARLMFANLLTLVDDWGRYEGDKGLLRRECFPLDDIRQKDVDEWIESLEQNDLLTRYEVDGAWYVQLRRWTERTRSKSSKYPALPCPDNKCCAVTTNAAPKRSAKGVEPNGAGAGADDGEGAGEDVRRQLQATFDGMDAESTGPPRASPANEDDEPFASGGGSLEPSRLVAVLEKLGRRPERQSGWFGIEVQKFIEANGGEEKATALLERALAAGRDTWNKAKTWCMQADIESAREDFRNGQHAAANGKGERQNPSGQSRGASQRSERDRRQPAEPDRPVPVWRPTG